VRLVGTTKPTIEAIRNRTHWNSAQLTPMDPVTLGICKQIDLDLEVKKSAADAPARQELPEDPTLLSPEESVNPADPFGNFKPTEAPQEEPNVPDAASVFANFAPAPQEEDEE
jgi:hypothetical protein